MGNMSKSLSTFTVVVALLAFSVAAPVQAQNAAEIIALAKAQWSAENQNKSAADAMATLANDYTEFNAVAPTLVEGKALASRFYDASLRSGDTNLASEMLNPHVQFYGTVAILTYNYMGLTQGKDGKVTPNLAKSTRVYAQQEGKWKLVHANFAAVVVPKE